MDDNAIDHNYLIVLCNVDHDQLQKPLLCLKDVCSPQVDLKIYEMVDQYVL